MFQSQITDMLSREMPWLSLYSYNKYIQTCIHIYACIYINVCTYIYTCIYTYIYMYTCTYIHTHSNIDMYTYIRFAVFRSQNTEMLRRQHGLDSEKLWHLCPVSCLQSEPGMCMGWLR